MFMKLADEIEFLENLRVVQAYTKFRGNVSRGAKALGIGRVRFYKVLARVGSYEALGHRTKRKSRRGAGPR